MTKYRLNVKSDIYCEEDQLGFDTYIDTLNTMFTDKDFKTPFCIGIFGKWGSGKTSFMRLLEKRLLKNTTKPRAIPVWFNPWRYEKEEHLIIPFLKTIEHGIRKYEEDNKGIGNAILKKLKKACVKVAEASAAFAYGIKADAKLGGFGFTLDSSKTIARGEELTKKRLEDAKKLAERLSSLYYEIVNELKGAVDETSFRIVVFVDDLDRCLPDKAVELLEAIKLFLDIEGYLFVIGVDREVVKKGISYRYRFFEHREEKEKESLIISPEDYLDKMIQLPLELPTIEHGRKKTFIESLMDNSDGFKEHSSLIIDAGIGENPRSLKRFINLLAFIVNLAETLKGNIINDKVKSKETGENKELLRNYFIPLLYMKWTIIVFRYPKIHNDIKGNPKRLIEIQSVAKSIGDISPKTEEEKTEKTGIQIDERLKKVLANGEVFPDNDWLIERFIHLTESTVVSKKDKSGTAGFTQSFRHGETVLIPKGKFLYGEDKIGNDKIKDDYKIDVYPVTNKQYKEFVDETDYEVPYRDDEDSKPYIWDKEKRIFPEGMEGHPVVLVSHEDAVAFCEWRSKKEGVEIRLPTEEEWEKAARGRDGREYPWGDKFDFNRLNCADYHVKKELKDADEWRKEFLGGFYEKNKMKTLTMKVGSFSDGTSPYGCHDMAGNVWEWTSSYYDNKEEALVLRGGSWNNGSDDCRCANRDFNVPDLRVNNVGFRCARTLTL
ncbi:MAG: SUMF1/EgtB/PvdO family nonheme iron enzyme [Candidatus Scalindua sp.]|nr:SUMF1/EgtB/PvdO family nonheme iron enzyme [Candidatus Scalindua sp.]